MRKYQPLWNRIKEYKEAKVRADIALHPRIIQAVRKEKTMDDGWKLLCSEAGHKYKLLEEIDMYDSSIIHFYLIDMSL